MIPQTFEQWQNCIVNDCKIRLTEDFAKQRLAVYNDVENPETQKFMLLYGAQHLENIVQWFGMMVKEDKWKLKRKGLLSFLLLYCCTLSCGCGQKHDESKTANHTSKHINQCTHK